MTELKAQAATAYRLEREETFREACALGNERVVQQMLRTGGIVVNGQNRVNGWTALHWATARGHTSIIELLLAYNADPSVAATDGRLPLDMTKDDAIKALLSTTLNGSLLPSQSNTNEPLLFTPHYLEQPDLGRVWATPEEFEPALPRTTTLIATANQNISNTDTNNKNSSSISNASNTSLPRELIVYKEEASPDNMLGAIQVAQQHTIRTVLQQCQEELDIDDTTPIRIKRVSRLRGTLQAVPISEKQYDKTMMEIFGTTISPDNDPSELILSYYP